MEDFKNTEKTCVNIKYVKNLEINDNNDKDCNIINRNLTLGLLNIRSLISKTDTIYDLIHGGLDIFVLVETWHGSSNNISVKSSMPPGYSYVDFLRINDPHHGGLIIYFSNEFKFKKIDLPIFSSIEALAVKLFISNKDFVLLALYRPGSVLVSNLFFEEFLCLLENITSFSLNILLGDFNIHLEKQEDRHTVNLLEILEMFQLKNLIDEPTHEHGGILDLIICSQDFQISDIKIFPSGTFSDHSLIQVNIPLTHKRPKIVKKQETIYSYFAANCGTLNSKTAHNAVNNRDIRQLKMKLKNLKFLTRTNQQLNKETCNITFSKSNSQSPLFNVETATKYFNDILKPSDRRKGLKMHQRSCKTHEQLQLTNDEENTVETSTSTSPPPSSSSDVHQQPKTTSYQTLQNVENTETPHLEIRLPQNPA
ncbi:hypothetical protein HELRODRAFT_160110 [Helobdella robusta]|uniref:Endonuclease/exonuclease/phosphatase domain-containing protein n=1 Tax=Helobdella robusta TaxID=6412 RepID=T1EPT3_HELRO|nr:hypothetical protein HELRODRAFT_160110 [Helobdella robusta]ESO06004.1 hypothetical protein HELRODRAFT_160110 [Helobdella robusta]